MVIVADIDGFTVKRFMVDSGRSYNVLTWEAVMALQENLENLRKVENPLVGIREKLVKMERSMELPITLGEKH